MEIYIAEPLCKLCNKEEETVSQSLFEYAALSQRTFAMKNTLELSLEKDLPNMVLNTLKGTNLFE